MGSESSRPFPEVLGWHLDNGTRPDGSPEKSGQLWSNAAFGQAVGVSDRTVRNWRTGKSYPDDIRSLESSLFGDNPAYARERQELRTAPRAPSASPVSPRRPRAKFPIAPPARCFGRDVETKSILDGLLAHQAAILVLGPPGIGKSTLLRRVRCEIVVKPIVPMSSVACASRAMMTDQSRSDERPGLRVATRGMSRCPREPSYLRPRSTRGDIVAPGRGKREGKPCLRTCGHGASAGPARS